LINNLGILISVISCSVDASPAAHVLLTENLNIELSSTTTPKINETVAQHEWVVHEPSINY
jgi:hypothetical protein